MLNTKSLSEVKSRNQHDQARGRTRENLMTYTCYKFFGIKSKEAFSVSYYARFPQASYDETIPSLTMIILLLIDYIGC